MFPESVPIIFKTSEEILAFCNLHSVINTISWIGTFRKHGFLEISRNSIQTRLPGSEPTGCNATKNELPNAVSFQHFGKFSERGH